MNFLEKKLKIEQFFFLFYGCDIFGWFVERSSFRLQSKRIELKENGL